MAAEDARFAQLEPRRGLAVFGGAHVRYVQRAGWGNAMYHLLRADAAFAVVRVAVRLLADRDLAGSNPHANDSFAKWSTSVFRT